MKKIFAFLVPIFVVIALFLFINNFEGEYNLLNQLELAIDNLHFENPINELLDIIKTIRDFEFGDESVWLEILNILKLIGDIFILPINILKVMIEDLATGLQFILIILGFNVGV